MPEPERNSHDDLIKRVEALETGTRGYDRGLAERIEQVETQMKSLVVSGVQVQVPTLVEAWKDRIAELERRTDALDLHKRTHEDTEAD